MYPAWAHEGVVFRVLGSSRASIRNYFEPLTQAGGYVCAAKTIAKLALDCGKIQKFNSDGVYKVVLREAVGSYSSRIALICLYCET